MGRVPITVATRRQKEKEADRLFFEVLKLRAGGECEKCGKTSGLAPHHIFTREIRATRWYSNNGVLLCSRCHLRWAHKYYEDFRDWFIKEHGEDFFRRLKYAASHRGSQDVDEWILVLRNELAVLERDRA